MRRSLTKDEFVSRSREKHGDRYDYSKTVYVTTRKKVEIGCKIHGGFWQAPRSHLQRKGCPTCGEDHRATTQRFTNEEFIEKSKLQHGDRYDYSNVYYTHSRANVNIICKDHGMFSQSPGHHLQGHGCPVCGVIRRVNIRLSTNEEFIEKSKLQHGDRYDYSMIEYINSLTKVNIICKVHGAFSQTPSDHLRGHGCPTCRSSRGNMRVSQYLTNNDIKFESEKKFPGMRYKQSLFLDFYLPDSNLAIEFDGRQHFEVVDVFGGKEEFEKIQIRDRIKNEFCRETGIHLLRIRYDEINDTEKLIESFVNTIN
jgi:very-short-patch-repair endonuclease